MKKNPLNYCALFFARRLIYSRARGLMCPTATQTHSPPQLHNCIRPPQEQFAISALLSCLCCDATDANASGLEESAFGCVTQKDFPSNGIPAADNFNLIVYSQTTISNKEFI